MKERKKKGVKGENKIKATVETDLCSSLLSNEDDISGRVVDGYVGDEKTSTC